MKNYPDITGTIGNTPLVRMRRIGHGLPGKILLKLEFFNPLSSVKDRIALAMIEDAERSGQLKPGMHVLEPTSGNTGIGLAFVCAAKGYPITLIMPETMSMERRTLLLLMGAEIILTPAATAIRGAIAKALELADQDPKYFMPRQFENPANPAIHHASTAEEIWRDTGGEVDRVICGVGTGGTLTGIGQNLKNKKHSVKMIAVEPAESAVISGEKPAPHKIQGIGTGFIPANLDRTLIAGIEKVSSEEAIAMAKRVLREEGIPVGISGGAAIVAALRQASLPEAKGETLVTLIASTTERYLSTLLGEDARTRASALPIVPALDQYLARVPLGPMADSNTVGP